MIIKFLSNELNYRNASIGSGEGAYVELTDIHTFFSMASGTESGLFVEMLDENNTVFCQTVGLYRDENNNLNLAALSFATLRHKKRLPMKMITKRVDYLVTKYGIDTAVG